MIKKTIYSPDTLVSSLIKGAAVLEIARAQAIYSFIGYRQHLCMLGTGGSLILRGLSFLTPSSHQLHIPEDTWSLGDSFSLLFSAAMKAGLLQYRFTTTLRRLLAAVSLKSSTMDKRENT